MTLMALLLGTRILVPGASDIAESQVPPPTVSDNVVNLTRRDTLRPVKHLDTAGSLRLSQEFVGADGTGKAGSSRSGGSGGSGGQLAPLDTTEESLNRKKSRSSGRLKKAKSKPPASAVAGRAMVSEVILPNIEKVRQSLEPLYYKVTNGA